MSRWEAVAIVAGTVSLVLGAVWLVCIINRIA